MFVRHNLPTSWKPPLSPETWESLLDLYPGNICGNSSFITGLDISAALGRVWLGHTYTGRPRNHRVGKMFDSSCQKLLFAEELTELTDKLHSVTSTHVLFWAASLPLQAAPVCPQIQKRFSSEAEKWKRCTLVLPRMGFVWWRCLAEQGSLACPSCLQLLPRLPACIPGVWETAFKVIFLKAREWQGLWCRNSLLPHLPKAWGGEFSSTVHGTELFVSVSLGFLCATGWQQPAILRVSWRKCLHMLACPALRALLWWLTSNVLFLRMKCVLFPQWFYQLLFLTSTACLSGFFFSEEIINLSLFSCSVYQGTCLMDLIKLIQNSPDYQILFH